MNKISEYNNLLPLKFEINNLKNAIKYKLINKKIINKLKQKNNIIIAQCYKNKETKKTYYLCNNVFDNFYEKNNCIPLLSQYKKMIKNNNATKYELDNIYEIYSYNLLKNIKKTQNYTNFLQIFNNFIKINRFIINLKKLKINKLNHKIGAVFNSSFFAFFCNNGVNYFLINKQQITNFSHNLIKKNNFEILINKENIFENGLYTFYSNYAIISKKNSYAIIKICGNNILIKTYTKHKSEIEIKFDKNCEVKNIANKFYMQKDTQQCKIEINTRNVKIINTENYIGYKLINKENYVEISLVYNNFNKTILTKSERKKINNQILNYYKISNNVLSKKELLELSQFNINMQIKYLPNLQIFGFKQCNKNQIEISNLNFNEKILIPNKNLHHLFCDGKIYCINNILKNESIILLNNLSEIFIDVCCVNFYYKKICNCIKIFIPLLNQFFYLNCSEKINDCEKVFNFIKINFKSKINALLYISEQKQVLKTDNIFKFAMQYKHNALTQINVDFCLPDFNINLFNKQLSKINIFSEEFAILHQKINKKCAFLPLFFTFKHKNEILNLFLSHTNWLENYSHLVLDYIYFEKQYFLAETVKRNLEIIINNCKNNNLKLAITDQIGQLLPTVIDGFYCGNFKLAKSISSFYFCYVYVSYICEMDNRCSGVYKKFEKINLLSDNKKLIINKQNNILLNNINYVGFDKIENNGKIFLNF